MWRWCRTLVVEVSPAHCLVKMIKDDEQKDVHHHMSPCEEDNLKSKLSVLATWRLQADSISRVLFLSSPVFSLNTRLVI